MTARPLDWLDLTGAGFALLGLVQRRRAAFFRRLRLCIAKQKSRTSPSSAALRPQAVRARSSPLHRSPSRPRRSRPEIERNFDMATIGTFTQAANGSFTGTIKTLTLNAKATLRPIDKESEKAPDYRLAVGSVECGAGWKKTSRENREYISVKLDDPTFPAPIYATLSETDTAGEYALIWSR
jgi:uncharacterized protein (DUF736 family)